MSSQDMQPFFIFKMSLFKKLIRLFLFLVTLTGFNGYCQLEDELYGGWVLNSNYEFPDIIIFRSDHKYFVYNSNSVSSESIGATDNLKDNDILVNGAYTSMTERGSWYYDPHTKTLILKERNILSKWTDFSAVYGNSKVMEFYLKELSNNKMILCFKKQDKQVCDEYERNWSYITKDGNKIFYKELCEEYVGIGNYEKHLLLSGYETELKLNYDFNKGTSLFIFNQNGKEIFSTKITSLSKNKIDEIPLRGITELVIKLKNIDSSVWKLRVEIK